MKLVIIYCRSQFDGLLSHVAEEIFTMAGRDMRV